ncbi:MAG TPA: hypothetical protein VGQ46_00795 [Thermoanaerobaculia bacterium]|jgi:hypothetical protein|nr:hypothetical protein [Thermoanaerobaculia bacterium]
MDKAVSQTEIDKAWERYFSHQLSESEKAEARKRMLADLQQAKEEGVFRRMKEWRGKIRWSISLEELRKDDD